MEFRVDEKIWLASTTPPEHAVVETTADTVPTLSNNHAATNSWTSTAANHSTDIFGIYCKLVEVGGYLHE